MLTRSYKFAALFLMEALGLVLRRRGLRQAGLAAQNIQLLDHPAVVASTAAREVAA